MDERSVRKVLNSKENTIGTISHYPGSRNIPEGQFLLAHPKGKPVRLYKKLKGMLWWLNFTRDGNHEIEKDLKVKGNMRVGKTYKSSDGSEGISDTINFTDDHLDDHEVVIKNGIVTSWEVT